MNGPQSENSDVDATGSGLTFPDFEVSWAGRDPSTPWLRYYGSEDGRVRILSDLDSSRQANLKFDSLDESINGVAFSGSWIAASTRCEVIFIKPSRQEGGRRPRIYEGGAHGIAARSSGGFVAPLGVNGLLVMTPGPNFDLSVSISKPVGSGVNFQKLVHLSGDDQKDYYAIAGRKSGLVGIEIQAGHFDCRSDQASSFHAPGVDIVDICSFGSIEWPRAVAGLGEDGSIHLCKDLFGDRVPLVVRCPDLRGVAYSVLGNKNHLVLLSSKNLYILPNLIDRFLRQDEIDSTVAAMSLPIKAVEIYQAGDELFIILAEGVVGFSIEDTARLPDPLGRPSSNRPPGTTISEQGDPNQADSRSQVTEKGLTMDISTRISMVQDAGLAGESTGLRLLEDPNSQDWSAFFEFAGPIGAS